MAFSLSERPGCLRAASAASTFFFSSAAAAPNPSLNVLERPSAAKHSGVFAGCASTSIGARMVPAAAAPSRTAKATSLMTPADLPIHQFPVLLLNYEGY